MLQPANRLTFIESMRPPVGFVFESAMAVTYTLNLSALLVVPAVLTLSAPADDADGALESVELIHALRSHAGRLTVFNQIGEIGLPASRPIFAFLEQAVVGVTAPRGGIVHPKVWVLRYEEVEPADGREPERRLRVLVSSRNLTFDNSWDTVVRLDETAGPGGASLAPIGTMFEELLDRAEDAAGDRPIDGDHRSRVSSLTEALQAARFQLPEEVSDLRVHVLGSSRTAATPPSEDGDSHSPLPLEADRSLIISPFVSDDFFTSVHPFSVDELVSRPESLDGLKTDIAQRSCEPSKPGCPLPESLANVGTVHAFDDGSPSIPDADDDRRTADDPGRPQIGLHAKVFAFEEGDRARLFLGSANATGPAFRKNLEVLVELVGSVAALGIDRLCEGTDDEPGLRCLFYDYRPSCDESGDAKSSLDHLCRKIAHLQITGQVEASRHWRGADSDDRAATKISDHPSDGAGAAQDGEHAIQTGEHTVDDVETWSVTYRSIEPLPQKDGVEIHCWPLSTAGNRRRVTGGEPLDACFVTSLENLSGFLAFELAAEDGALSSFVVPVPLVGVPEQRDRLLLRMLIGNEERFFRYLMSFLEEAPAEFSLLDTIERISDEPVTPEGGGSVNFPVLERLLRTMRRDPAKLASLHPLVWDLAADDALPEGFAELWAMILDVAETGIEAQ